VQFQQTTCAEWLSDEARAGKPRCNGEAVLVADRDLPLLSSTGHVGDGPRCEPAVIDHQFHQGVLVEREQIDFPEVTKREERG